MNRVSMLELMQNHSGKPWDVIVIGGGATGLGCAVDALSRGYDTLLLEASDFAKSTSSKSTKLLHGGVRYMAKGEMKLVREALHERGILFQSARHLARNTEFIIPVYSTFEKYLYTSGLKIYDWLSGTFSLGPSH
ncbi:MAG: FAD-dependent oxidoreductase, partial [Candidatus Kuenenia stuttgartiensis]|nr:FAD-dependent oxidoreductase [Candidatus Kuenenia stuttgartiensis]